MNPKVIRRMAGGWRRDVTYSWGPGEISGLKVHGLRVKGSG